MGCSWDMGPGTWAVLWLPSSARASLACQLLTEGVWAPAYHIEEEAYKRYTQPAPISILLLLDLFSISKMGIMISALPEKVGEMDPSLS